ncbi:hypothetical protein SLE2022_105740 [Rubroshorea leprosula]
MRQRLGTWSRQTKTVPVRLRTTCYYEEKEIASGVDERRNKKRKGRGATGGLLGRSPILVLLSPKNA